MIRPKDRIITSATASPRLAVAGSFLAALVAVALGVGTTACERRDVGRTADDRGAEIARVNDTSLFQRDFDRFLPPDYQRALTRDERRVYLERWITTQILYDEALDSGIGVTPDIELRVEQLKKDLVADRLVQKVIREQAVVTDAEVRAYYQAHHDQYTKEYRVSHIVVGSLEDAEKVKEELQRKPFSTVARVHSLDKHTGAGGDLGFLSKGNMIPEFEAVVFTMAVGEISDVVESDFGYHIIRLTDVRVAREGGLDYEDAAEEISRVLLLERRARVYDELIASLRRKAFIEILLPDLKLRDEEVPADTAGFTGGMEE